MPIIHSNQYTQEGQTKHRPMVWGWGWCAGFGVWGWGWCAGFGRRRPIGDAMGKSRCTPRLANFLVNYASQGGVSVCRVAMCRINTKHKIKFLTVHNMGYTCCVWAGGGGTTEFSRIIDQICWSCAFSLTCHVC